MNKGDRRRLAELTEFVCTQILILQGLKDLDSKVADNYRLMWHSFTQVLQEMERLNLVMRHGISMGCKKFLREVDSARED